MPYPSTIWASFTIVLSCLKIVSIYHLVKLCSFKLLKSPTEKPEENSTLSKTLFRRRRRSLFEFSFESRDNDAKAIVQPLSYKREETNYKFWTLRRLPLLGWELFLITRPGRNIEPIFYLQLVVIWFNSINNEKESGRRKVKESHNILSSCSPLFQLDCYFEETKENISRYFFQKTKVWPMRQMVCLIYLQIWNARTHNITHRIKGKNIAITYSECRKHTSLHFDKTA